jgi:hypothetical protein
MTKSSSHSYVTSDGESVGSYWCRSPPVAPDRVLSVCCISSVSLGTPSLTRPRMRPLS